MHEPRVGLRIAPDISEVTAWVQRRAGQTASVEELEAFCRGQFAPLKIPRYIRFVEAFLRPP